MYIRRKVFSNTGYDFEPVEGVYNVTMSEDEVRLFSEIQERMYAYMGESGVVGMNNDEFKMLVDDYRFKNKGVSLKDARKAVMESDLFKKAMEDVDKDAFKAAKAQGYRGSYDSWLDSRKRGNNSISMFDGGAYHKEGKAAVSSEVGKLAKAKEWIKNNRKLAAGIGAGAVLAGGAAAYAANKD